MPEGMGGRVSRYHTWGDSNTIVCYRFIQQLEICNLSIAGVELFYLTIREEWKLPWKEYQETN